MKKPGKRKQWALDALSWHPVLYGSAQAESSRGRAVLCHWNRTDSSLHLGKRGCKIWAGCWCLAESRWASRKVTLLNLGQAAPAPLSASDIAFEAIYVSRQLRDLGERETLFTLSNSVFCILTREVQRCFFQNSNQQFAIRYCLFPPGSVLIVVSNLKF